MRILVVAATEEEVAPLISELRITNYDFKEEDEGSLLIPHSQIVNRKSEIVNQITPSSAKLKKPVSVIII